MIVVGIIVLGFQATHGIYCVFLFLSVSCSFGMMHTWSEYALLCLLLLLCVSFVTLESPQNRPTDGIVALPFCVSLFLSLHQGVS